jgi:hypothetical protein
MKMALTLVVLCCGCAAAPVRSGEAVDEASFEVTGHVTNGCHIAQAQPRESVTLRAAGELDAVATTQTDATGAFSFVVPPGDAKRKFYIEARGSKAMAVSRYDSSRTLVAELTLPCTRG